MSLNLFQGESLGELLTASRCGIPPLSHMASVSSLAAFLPAEHQRLLRRLVAWQLQEGLPQRNLMRGARRPHGAKRFAPAVLLSRISFPERGCGSYICLVAMHLHLGAL
jgi:hypothetical protein